MDRKNKSDSGISLLTKDTLKNLFGLSGPTVSRIVSIIKEKGEYSAMKDRVRSLSGQTHKRLILAIEKAEEDFENQTDEEGDDVNSTPEATSKDTKKKTDKKDTKEKETEEVKESFIDYLIEFGDEASSGTTVRNMDQKDLKRMASMDGERRNKMMDRKEQEQKRKTKNPRMRSLLLKREQLNKQIEIEKAKGA